MNWRRRRSTRRSDPATAATGTVPRGTPVSEDDAVAAGGFDGPALGTPAVRPGEGRAPGRSLRPLPPDGARVVCVTNQKGGVGKTTTAVSCAAALADLGLEVLLVDVDPQGNASTGLDVRVEGDQVATYDVVVDRAPATDAIVETAVPGLHLLPSSLDLAGAEVELVAKLNRERRLAQALTQVRDTYHVILLDCPPSLGILTLNALVAADEALVPIQTEYYALEGVTQLLRTIDLVRADLNEELVIGAVVLTMVDARTNLSRQVADEIRDFFGDTTCRTVIPRTVRLSEAPSFGQPITAFDPSSRGAQAYRRLAAELAGRWDLVPDAADPLDALLGTTTGT
jgi:chromosome partitioning protein